MEKKDEIENKLEVHSGQQIGKHQTTWPIWENKRMNKVDSF